MLVQHNNVCAICLGINKNGWRLAVDHDHKTGKIRGLLCGNCNRGIGHLKESKFNFEQSIRYLGL